ncbi:MAG: SdpI family protein [Candidatus Bathyarchaeia archaeon]|nr:SdpI family protein [Candidatus Bathyarchaeota archaeon]
MRKIGIIALAIVLFSFLMGAYFYPKMPERMVSHWNHRGEVDGYTSRLWGSFTLPFILAGLSLLFTAIPKIDPLKANIEKFRRHYDRFIILVLIFTLSVHLQIILWNIGVKLSPNLTFPIGLSILFYYAGILCENSKRNWFIGIRTPWTLSSERVWDKTHRIGGKLFKISGVIALLGIPLQRYIIFLVLTPAILTAIYTTVYSCFEYQKEIN